MSFRFFNRVRIAPGLTLNLSKTGASVSAGPRGAKFTVGTSGSRATVGLPGSGLFYTVSNPVGKARAAMGSGSGGGSGGNGGGAASVPASQKPTLSFFQRLSTPAQEKAFVDALAAMSEGKESEALNAMEASVSQDASMADAAWLAGLMRLKLEHLDVAERHFRLALQHASKLGQLFSKYGLTPRIGLQVTPEVMAQLLPNAHSALLGLVEVLQLQGNSAEALVHLEALLEQQPDDPVALASYAELALDTTDPQRWQKVVALTASIENETAVHTAVMLYRGLALSRLGMDAGAESVFTIALRRSSGRSEGLLREIRYQRALVYERLGKKAQARRELERIYAEDPAFEDVARRLGL